MPIQSLASETLTEIFILVGQDRNVRSRTRDRTLRSASLVCRWWRSLAQPLLWKDVSLAGLNAVTEFLTDKAKVGGTTTALELAHFPPFGRRGPDLDSSTAARAIAACPGLRKLKLCGIHDLDAEVLFLPGLANLTDIEFVHTSFARSSFRRVLPSLSALSCVGSKPPFKAWSSRLAPLLLQRSIITLQLRIPMSGLRAHLPLLLTLAPKLTNLLLYITLNGSVLRLLRPFLTSCHSRRHFSLDDESTSPDPQTILRLLPSHLESYSCLGWLDLDAQEGRTLLQAELPALSNLRQLVYPNILLQGGEGSSWYKKLREECTRPGIELLSYEHLGRD